MAAFQLNLQSGRQKKVGLARDASHVALDQEVPGTRASVRRCVVVMQQPVSFLIKVRSEVFAHFHAVAVKRHCSMLEQIHCEQLIPLISKNEKSMFLTLLFACLGPGDFGYFPSNARVWPTISAPDACLIIAWVWHFLRYLHKIWCTLAVGIYREIASGRKKSASPPSRMKFCTPTSKIYWYNNLLFHHAPTIVAQMAAPVPEIMDCWICTQNWSVSTVQLEVSECIHNKNDVYKLKNIRTWNYVKNFIHFDKKHKIATEVLFLFFIPFMPATWRAHLTLQKTRGPYSPI
jgi:hypothetical protein